VCEDVKCVPPPCESLRINRYGIVCSKQRYYSVEIAEELLEREKIEE
jgi:hypothetical protein